MARMDLHIHSAWSSDGEFGPEEIVGKCRDAGVELFSLTDHNSVKGIEQAEVCAREVGIGFVPGIEIDCNYKGTDMHLLGYGIDWLSADFARLEAAVAARVKDSFRGMIDNLLRLGFAVDADAVLAAAGERLPSAELIAEVMLGEPRFHTPLLEPYLEGGSRSDMPFINFYLDYFAQGRQAFVPVEYMRYEDALELVRDNRGIPVVAHPGLNFRGRERIAEELLRRGAAALEVFNNYHDAAQTDFFARLVVREKAGMTCGSDFHGKTKPRIAVGQYRSPKGYERFLSDFADRLKILSR